MAGVHSDDYPPERAGPLRVFFHGSDGPLPALLLLLTTVTGLVDSVSYFVLGKVFVANMAGNLIFVGFGLSAVGPAVASSAIAIGSGVASVLTVVFGAFCGGLLLRVGDVRAPLLLAIALLLIAAAGVAVLSKNEADWQRPHK
ncbi:DUF1275 family protein [Streptomyces maoxianensis]|uniref:DUF1275 family protein n=1 Tax=Streptomyces maoxianensis TaxID=1459942 RepID=A0ABV9GBA9_9ACTN